MSLDRRSRRAVFVAHCILNQNVRVAGGAHYPAMIDEVVDLLKAHRVGLVQMPCPEFSFAGLNRPPRTKEEYDTHSFREHCAKIAGQIVDEADEYVRNGFKVLAFLGVERSPSCGVKQTTTRPDGSKGEAKATSGQGILTEGLRRELSSRHLQIPFRGVDWKNIPKLVEEIQGLLDALDGCSQEARLCRNPVLHRLTRQTSR
ncbi:MAG: 2-thiouracil desulfurase family protein [Candidatus Bathyarchaeia archaeon]